jgi:hypothetical protein
MYLYNFGFLTGGKGTGLLNLSSLPPSGLLGSRRWHEWEKK